MNFIFVVLIVVAVILPKIQADCITEFLWPEFKVDLETTSTGFRLSVPDKEEVTCLEYNVKINEAFLAFEPGKITGTVKEKTKNLWVFQLNTVLKNKDVVHVWIKAHHKKYVFVEYDTYHKANPIIVALKFEPSPNKNTDLSCGSTITTVRSGTTNACKGELIFEDNFAWPLKEHWKHEVHFSINEYDDFVLFESENAKIENNSTLTITAKLWNDYKPGTTISNGVLDLENRCTGTVNEECKLEVNAKLAHKTLPPVVTGRINTKESFSFKYGRIEIRAKLPVGDWLVPLLLLEPLTKYYGTDDFNSGQMHVALAFGNENLFTENNVILDGHILRGGGLLTVGRHLREKFVNTSRSEHFGNDYHVYTLLWDENSLHYKVDGSDYGTIDGNYRSLFPESTSFPPAWNTASNLAPFDKEFYITLGLTVGGHGYFRDGSISNDYRKPWMNTDPKAARYFWNERKKWKPTWKSPSLEIDYIRVYAI